MSDDRLFLAVRSLCPTACFCVRDGVLEWLDEIIKQPSDAKIRGEMDRLERVKAANAYKLARAAAYPSIGDQLDMLWHAMESKEIPVCSSFYNAIKAVKDATPKP